MSVILEAENISKQYRLGLVGTGSLSDDLKRWWCNIRGKEDPFLQIGAVNDRGAKAKEDYVWALRDINFKVKEGEVLGIIGKNGAGKSTLLKLLSRVTAPTTGSIRTRGRIASLLEVGTGFHPELTGRENIFLNGAILGMTKPEIRTKLEEIIDFSGCEMYIDTPVKRYSSGMRVRLGFAVAAHLEPEILVVDEVLAVGDAEFQRKAIGKMQDLSAGEGRTVLFVSHNMGSVRRLCNRALILESGKMIIDGPTDEVVEKYLKKEFENLSSTGEYKGNENVGRDFILNKATLLNSGNEITSVFLSEESIEIQFLYTLRTTCRDMRINLMVLSSDETVVFTTSSHDSDRTDKLPGKYFAQINLPKNFFNKGSYKVRINAGIPNLKFLFEPQIIFKFEIEKLTQSGSRVNETFPGVTAPLLGWKVKKEK